MEVETAVAQLTGRLPAHRGRRALLGDQVASFDTLAFLSDQALLVILAGFAVVLLVASAYFYRWALHTAKEKGLLDMESGY